MSATTITSFAAVIAGRLFLDTGLLGLPLFIDDTMDADRLGV